MKKLFQIIAKIMSTIGPFKTFHIRIPLFGFGARGMGWVVQKVKVCASNLDKQNVAPFSFFCQGCKNVAL